MTKRSSADMDGPTPLLLRLPANAASLAIIRARLRRWMPTAAVDAAAAADILLAVGEAASNAIEHATRGSSHEVELEVSARTTRTGLVLTVRDTGRWHPPHEPPGLRGHGSRLMNALVDAVTITPTPQGTTVEMRKELHP